MTKTPNPNECRREDRIESAEREQQAQIEKPVVPLVAVPVFDRQNSKVAPSKRTEVLAMLEKKYRSDEFDCMIRVTEMDGK
jgi:hypothetical protein